MYLSIDAAAFAASVSRSTVKRWILASEKNRLAGWEPDFEISDPPGSRTLIHRASFLLFLARHHRQRHGPVENYPGRQGSSPQHMGLARGTSEVFPQVIGRAIRLTLSGGGARSSIAAG